MAKAAGTVTLKLLGLVHLLNQLFTACAIFTSPPSEKKTHRLITLVKRLINSKNVQTEIALDSVDKT